VEWALVVGRTVVMLMDSRRAAEAIASELRRKGRRVKVRPLTSHCGGSLARGR
jgi:hypothetical protein